MANPLLDTLRSTAGPSNTLATPMECRTAHREALHLGLQQVLDLVRPR